MSYPEDPCDVCGVVEWSRGVDFERERIIALLEESMCLAYGEDCSNNPSCSARDAIIALIKGENE